MENTITIENRKKKTNEYIKIVLITGKTQKRTIYVDDNGKKYVYNQHGFYELENFVKTHKII